MSTTELNRREMLKLSAAATLGAAHTAHGNFTPARPSKPNVLLVMADQHRADCMGCSGNAACYTPHMDRLAREGARFTNMYSTTPTCTPARTALKKKKEDWML